MTDTEYWEYVRTLADTIKWIAEQLPLGEKGFQSRVAAVISVKNDVRKQLEPWMADNKWK